MKNLHYTYFPMIADNLFNKTLPERIIQTVSEYHKVSVADMKSKRKKEEIVEVRQIAMYFLRKYTRLSLKNIGSHFGNRDHSTVIHSLKKVQDLAEVEKYYKKELDILEKKLPFAINLDYKR